MERLLPESVTLFTVSPDASKAEVHAMSDAGETAPVSISGLAPNTEYFMYEDSHANEMPFTTDGNGSYSFEQDISEEHFVWVQSASSDTLFIEDNAQGGDCEAKSIGIWDASTKTCTLTDDIEFTGGLENNIEFASRGISLDCNGHSVTGSWGTYGVLAVYGKASVKNCTISGFEIGIGFWNYSDYNVLGNTFLNLQNPVLSYNASDILVKDNNIFLVGSAVSLNDGTLHNGGSAEINNNTISDSARGISTRRLENVSIIGNEITGLNKPSGMNYGVNIDGAENVIFKDNNILFNPFADAFSAEGASSVLVEDNNLFWNADAVALCGFQQVEFRHNRIEGDNSDLLAGRVWIYSIGSSIYIEDNTASSIDANTSAPTTDVNLLIADNIASSISFGGLSSNAAVFNNRVSGSGDKLGLGELRNSQVFGNNIVSTGGDHDSSLLSISGSGNKVFDNHMSSTSGIGYGLSLPNSHCNEITNNTMTGVNIGLRIRDSTSNEITWNKISGNKSDGINISGSADPSSNVIEFNDLSSNSRAGLFYQVADYNINAFHNWWGTTDEAQIAAKIRDGVDYPAQYHFGFVSFKPWLEFPPFSDGVLHLTEMPSYTKEQENYSGAAVAQMILNFIRAAASYPGFLQDGLYSYGFQYNDPLNSGLLDFDANAMDSVLGHFDPYDEAVTGYYDYTDSLPDGNPAQGYNYFVEAFESIEEYMHYIAHWMAFPVTQGEWWLDGLLVAEPNTPAAIPLYGSYNHWVAVNGYAASGNPIPEPHTRPWNTAEVTIYGFWLTDPDANGIGQHVYVTAADAAEVYFMPMDSGDDYNGLYVQVAEPPMMPEGMELDEIIGKVEIAMPAASLQNLGLIGAESRAVKSSSAGTGFTLADLGDLMPAAAEASWRTLVDSPLLLDAEAVSAFEEAEMAEPLLVKSAKDYYLVPFTKEGLTSAVIMLDAEQGYFKQASWAEQPLQYLAGEVDALEMVKQAANPERTGSIKIEFSLLDEASQALYWEQSEYSSSPFKPYWVVEAGGCSWIATQGGTVYPLSDCPSLEAELSEIADAPPESGGFLNLGKYFEVNASGEETFSLTFFYDDADNDGIVDGTGIGEESLAVYYYDNAWLAIEESERDLAGNTITVTVESLSG
ncbi:MAG: right-handed parallel beta-helix repeat-containing protein [Candidatus Diapherotrites archaeon]|uniref:Right-handed parallel beta-helix repeat-containing protein n=1 Tax=Candidatus Iainarchaeum sp. TaxID=3101447 RepID=A0A939C958_9ARCH|nr:right-handed parallel beta-helix repeat-containing protein [Candidatus Diapherotrites archaeon]